MPNPGRAKGPLEQADFLDLPNEWPLCSSEVLVSMHKAGNRGDIRCQLLASPNMHACEHTSTHTNTWTHIRALKESTFEVSMLSLKAKVDQATRFSRHPSPLTCYSEVYVAKPIPHPKRLQPVGCSSILNPDISVTWCFSHPLFTVLALVWLISLSPHTAQGPVHSELCLPVVPGSGYALIHNKPSPPGAVMAFPFYFFL